MPPKPIKPTDEAVVFLELLRPSGPWMLLAINPAGGTGAIEEVITVDKVDAVNAFVTKHNGKFNLYYSANPTRKPMTKKPTKLDIAVDRVCAVGSRSEAE